MGRHNILFWETGWTGRQLSYEKILSNRLDESSSLIHLNRRSPTGKSANTMPRKSNEFNDPSVCLSQCSLSRLGTLGSWWGFGGGRLGGETEETSIGEAMNAPDGLPGSRTSYVRLLGFILMVSAPYNFS